MAEAKKYFIEFSDINKENKLQELIIDRIADESLPVNFALKMQEKEGYIVLRSVTQKRAGKYKDVDRYYAVLPQGNTPAHPDIFTYHIYNLSITSALVLELQAGIDRQRQEITPLSATFYKEGLAKDMPKKYAYFNSFMNIDPLHQLAIELGSRAAAVAKCRALLSQVQAREDASNSHA